VCTYGPEEALENESPRVISVFIAAQFLKRMGGGPEEDVCLSLCHRKLHDSLVA
jgi:hypothetical protein